MMSDQDVSNFYDAMADDYHLIFADWVGSVERQSHVLDKLIRDHLPEKVAPVRVLDCACGIGTQALGLAKRGYSVHATDISAAEIERAKAEAQNMQVALTFGVADMQTVTQQIDEQFDVVLAFDNALPHLLTDEALAQAARELFAVTKPNGIFMASIRDYDALLAERPQITSERVMGSGENRRVTLQVWDWYDDTYDVTQFILVRETDAWQMRHYTTHYRALKREMLSSALSGAGFSNVVWLMPETSGFYQPVVVAKRSPQTAVG